MVIYQQNWEEVLKKIEDEFRAKPGAPRMFKHYQVAVKRVMAELDEDKLEKVKETAEEWLNNFPPPKMKDWEAIETVWQEYTQEQFGAEAQDRGQYVKGDGDGMLVLLDITETKLEEKKAIVRAFLTLHYRLCSRNDKAVIPWSAIRHSQDDFVARTFLPADVDLKEPSTPTT
ncbi:hypothetical protein BDR04DRAFT_1162993 [Suillus decipiens]|nr:hypothetical protein BDR04DRAFT_1162993 [Suillus decipiens]